MAIAKRALFAVVAFATAAIASAEAAGAAVAVVFAWSDLDWLDQDCSATMEVAYQPTSYLYDRQALFLECRQCESTCSK